MLRPTRPAAGFKPANDDAREAAPSSNGDAELLVRVSRGDKDAMRLLYEEYADSLYKFARSMMRDPHEASDVMHEAMMAAWRGAGSYDGRASVKSWLFGITRNKVVDRARKGSRTVYTDTEAEVEDETPSPLAQVLAKSDGDQIRDCVSRLKDAHRRAIHLSFFEDMTYQEIADAEGCPVGTVKTRVMHAKKLLLHCMNKKQRA